MRQNLESEFPSVNVIGEIANFKIHSSGHFYYTLRDEHSLIQSVLFRNYVNNIDFGPDNGMMVFARGRITHFPARGQTQLIVYYMEPAGRGQLELQKRRLIEKFKREGLLDAAKKRPIPPFPERIAVITSSSGAVISDISKTLSRRWPLAELVHIPADVQGAGAGESILSAFKLLSGMEGIDLVILARGGGSVEDLWTFNTEGVARAVIGSRYPVITGIGHETDKTVCDFVSDLSAPTPTAAAEMASPAIKDVKSYISSVLERTGELALRSSSRRMELVGYLISRSAFQTVKHRIERALFELGGVMDSLSEWWPNVKREKKDSISTMIYGIREAIGTKVGRSEKRAVNYYAALNRNDPEGRVHSSMERINKFVWVMRISSEKKCSIADRELSGNIRSLTGLGPSNVLRRGYTVCTKDQGRKILKGVDFIETGDEISVHFYRGSVDCGVKRKRGESRWPEKS